MGLEHGTGGQGLGCGTRNRVATTPTRTTDLILAPEPEEVICGLCTYACAALMAAPLWGAQLID